MFRAIVFDLDHTLFDRYSTIRKTFPAFYENYRDRIPKDLSVEEFIEKLIETEQKYIHYDWIRVIKECAKEGIISPMSEDEVKEAVGVIVNKCWPIAAVKFPFTIPTPVQSPKYPLLPYSLNITPSLPLLLLLLMLPRIPCE